MNRTADAAPLDDAGIERALVLLRGAVKARGLKGSSVREAVARVALRRKGHFTVDELVQDLRHSNVENAHMTTVYRTLPLLVDVGLLRLTLLSKGDEARYERSFEREHHDHILCTECGQVTEFYFEALETLQRELAEQMGFSLTGHIHELHGICKQCRRALKAGKKIAAQSGH
jgi:Fur family transcriptional regulator, ferric uptake regulator